MKEPTIIFSHNNAMFKLALSLNKQKFRKKHSLFLIEGTRAVLQAKENNITIKYIFVSEDFRKKRDDVWNEINCSMITEKYILDDNLFSKLSDTVASQGVIGMCEIPKYDAKSILSKEKSFILLLDQIQDPGNFGTIIRTSLAYGIDAIFFTKGSVDSFSPKVTRASMGGNLCLPLIEAEDGIDYFKKFRYTVYSASLSEKSVSYRDVNFESKVALILGNEGNGISADILNTSDYQIIIPIKEGMESLNVGVATGILINEISYKLYG